MVLSKSCIYGIQAAIFVAANGKGHYVSISRIAAELNISFHFLTKVLQQLTQSKLMLSYRGPKGGVVLARESELITLYDVISAIDGTEMFTECMLGLPGCGEASPCPAHEHWIEIRQDFTRVAREVTLLTLGDRASELNVRLAQEFKRQTVLPKT
ncbi:MAG: Rrf2 family transcriptional regulator [Candidatus Kapabacteria bacterium]|nr:Rrf2 family transcriptional regulator [Candidatus Kapabacteria bacterium]